MTYDITYEATSEMFQGRMKFDQDYFLYLAKNNPENKKSIAVSWLWEFDESILEDAERLNVLLPLIKWSVEQDMMIPFLEQELRYYYQNYTSGKLDNILAKYEAKDVITDLIWCYKTHFATM